MIFLQKICYKHLFSYCLQFILFYFSIYRQNIVLNKNTDVSRKYNDKFLGVVVGDIKLNMFCLINLNF